MPQGIAVKACAFCGAEFVGAPPRKLCEACEARRAELVKAKLDSLPPPIAQNVRKIGTAVPCMRCGSTIVVTAPRHAYCQKCHDYAMSLQAVAISAGVRATPEDKKCPVCGKAFVSKRNKVYCSPDCAKLGRNAKPELARSIPSPLDTEEERVCPVCGETFVGRKSIFCSPRCYNTDYVRRQRAKNKPIPDSTNGNRICRLCGKVFAGKYQATVCAECAEAQKHAVVRDRVCKSCGSPFKGGPHASYCPACRAERQKKAHAECQRRKRLGKVRALGSIDLCEVCGKPYVVRGGLQRYCEACATEAVKAKDREQGLKTYHEGGGKEARALLRIASNLDTRICPVCGKSFPASGRKKYCSNACCQKHWRDSHKTQSKEE